MGLLDMFGSGNDAAMMGGAGLLSPQDKLMALFQGLTQAGVGMAQPGLSKGQALAMGLGGFGQGMSRGNQSALQQRLLEQRMGEMKRKADQEEAQRVAGERFAMGVETGSAGGADMLRAGGPQAQPGTAANPQLAALIRAYPEMGAKVMADRLMPKQQQPHVVGQGGTLVGADGRPLFTSPPAPKDWQSPEWFEVQKKLREAGRQSVNVKVDAPKQFGTIPPGQRLVQNPDGSYELVDIPGGPTARAREKEAAAAIEGKTQQTAAADVVTQDINRIFKLMETATLPTTGAVGSLVSNVGGTAAGDISSLLTTVKANTAFERLGEMRKASPSGAALGAVSDKEMTLLAAVKGSLEQSQSQEQLRRNLARLHDVTLDIVHGPGQGGPRISQAPAVGATGTGGNYATMSKGDLAKVDPTKLSPAEAEAWRAAARKALGP